MKQAVFLLLLALVLVVFAQEFSQFDEDTDALAFGEQQEFENSEEPTLANEQGFEESFEDAPMDSLETQVQQAKQEVATPVQQANAESDTPIQEAKPEQAKSEEDVFDTQVEAATQANTLRRGGGFRSSGFRSSGFRSSGYRSSGYRSGYRSSYRSSYRGYRSGYRSSYRGYRGSYYRGSRTTYKIKYKPIKISYTSFKTRYPVIFRHRRPYVYVYGGVSYNTFSTYTFRGTFTEAEILRRLVGRPYRKTTMRIRYVTAAGTYVYYWRNVIIDLTTGDYYVIDPVSTAGSVILTKPINGGIPAPNNNSTGNSTTPATTAGGGASVLESDTETDAAVLNAQTGTTTATITANKKDETVSTNDAQSQQELRQADAAAQEDLSTVMQAVAGASTVKMTWLGLALALLLVVIL